MTVSILSTKYVFLMYPIEPPEPKWIDRPHLLYIINYDLHRGEDQTGTNPSPEFPKKV